MAPQPPPSSRFQRAAAAERDRLLRERLGLVEELDRRRAQVRETEERLLGLDHRLNLIEAAAGPGDPPTESSLTPHPGHELRGAEIRETAVRVLADSPEGSGPIHYRRWFELVERAGYAISGKRPDAVFLSQVTRSPVVRQSTKAGVYYLDLGAPAALRRRLEELRAELAATLAAASSAGGAEDKRSTQRKLMVEIERNQKALEEALGLFPDRVEDAGEEAA